MGASIAEECTGPGCHRLLFYPNMFRHLLKKPAGTALVVPIDGAFWSTLKVPSRRIEFSAQRYDSEQAAVKGVAEEFDRVWAGEAA